MSFRSAADQVDNDLRSAMVHYENKEYTKAIALFEKVLNQDNSRIGLNLYSGISNMEIQEYEKANENFQKIIDHSTNAFVESAEWYLGLCYLKTEEMNKAKSVFSDIANREGYFRKDARKVLRKIK
jgi:tetratricopeptide (TPR) repeat protein